MKVMHENMRRPKTKRKVQKSTKKHPKKPIAALLTGAQLPREIEREIIVAGRTFELNLPELNQEVAALESDSDIEPQILNDEAQKVKEQEKVALPEDYFLLPVRQIQLSNQQ